MSFEKQSKTRIQLKRLIGEGANARVFEGLRTDEENSISQKVAVKILRSRKSVDIWRKEFESMAQVRSIYCAQIFGFEWIEGLPALIMEYVEGQNLRDLLKSKRLKPAEIESLCAQVLKGLNDLRDQGLHHGDLSPDNILIDKSGRVRLIDFGGGNLNRATPEFCCPDRVAGGRPSYSSDVYSLKKVFQFICHQSDLESSNQAKLNFENLETRRTEALKSAGFDLKKMICLVALLVLCFSFSSSEGEAWRKAVSSLEVRSLTRLHIRLEGGPSGYAPFKLQRIDPGTHQIHWKTPYASGSRTLTVLPGTHIVLGLEDLK